MSHVDRTVVGCTVNSCELPLCPRSAECFLFDLLVLGPDQAAL
jgi:hypothetical protein